MIVTVLEPREKKNRLFQDLEKLNDQPQYGKQNQEQFTEPLKKLKLVAQKNIWKQKETPGSQFKDFDLQIPFHIPRSHPSVLLEDRQRLKMIAGTTGLNQFIY